jgi:pyruvate,water dikinase
VQVRGDRGWWAATLDDNAVDDHIEAAVNLLDMGTKIHFIVDFGHLLAVSELGLACQDLLSWDDARLFDLCAGLSPTSTEPAHELAELARLAADRPAVRSMLELPEPDLAAADLKAVDPEFADAFAAYQRTYGCRALHFDITQPTIAEAPELTLGLLRDQLARDYDPHADRSQLAITRAAAEQLALAAVPIAERDRFRRLLTRAQRAYPAREDNEFFAISAPLALVRLAALEAGRRLATRGLLGAPDDVFFLVLDEIHSSLRAGVDQRTVARRRRDEQAWTLAHPGPASYGRDPGPPPSLAGFPDEVRQTARTVEWFVDRALNPGDYTETDFGLVGMPASPGRYCGPARVISDESEFGKLKCGDVLVCRTTTPVWSVLFPRLGAIITETGGSLSHPAIIAREYRVPAVVATGRATEVLHDGQIVTVDGSAGTVKMQP